MTTLRNIIRGLFSRPTSQPDVPSPLDIEDVWGWGGSIHDVGLFPGAHDFLADQYPAALVASAEATVRAANGARR